MCVSVKVVEFCLLDSRCGSYTPDGSSKNSCAAFGDNEEARIQIASIANFEHSLDSSEV